MANFDGPAEPLLTSHDDDAQKVYCEHADRCGGCPLIEQTYAEQLLHKRARVVRSMARYGALEASYTEPVGAAVPRTEYRTRAKLIVGPGGAIGLFARGGGHQIVDIPNCRVLAPVLSDTAQLLRALVIHDEQHGGVLVPASGEGQGLLRAVDIREVRTGEVSRVLVTFVVNRHAAEADLERLRLRARELLEAAPDVVGVAVNFHDGLSPQVLGNETQLLAGADSADDSIGASTHRASYGSFVQAHRGQAQAIHELLARTLLGARDATTPVRVLDLYGGSGAIALALARRGAQVHVVESFQPAIDMLGRFVAEQKLPITGEAADATSALRRMVARGERFQAAIVNPPRRGLGPETREWLARLAVPTLAYVSCDPETLARDLDHLALLGYLGTALHPFDMIPLTEEVETVAILRRTSAPSARILYEDDELLVVEKAAHEPTVPSEGYASSLLQRLVRDLTRSGDAAELDVDNLVPVLALEPDASGIAAFAKSRLFAERWSPAFSGVRARQVFFAGSRGITPAKAAIARDLRDYGRMHPARTRYRRLAVLAGHSILRVVPEGTRPHQIRRHLAAVGHPVLGDDRYGHAPTNRFFEERHGLDRCFLHCIRVEVDHPATGQRLLFESPLPGDLRSVLERAGGPNTLRFLDNKNALGSYSSLPPKLDDSGEEPHPTDAGD